MTTAKQIIKDAYKTLGIRFLDLTENLSSRTAGDIVSAAFSKITIKGSETPLTAIELSEGLQVLEDLLAEWRYDDIDLGISGTLSSSTTGFPDWSLSGVKSNLAIRLASEYNKPIVDSLSAESLTSLAQLKERTSEGNLENGLTFLDDMMAEWDQLNIRIGYLNPTTVDGDTGLPDYSIAAVKYSLAVRIASITEKPLTPALMMTQKESYDNLVRQTVTDGLFTVYPDILPIGAGNQRCRAENNNYFENPVDNDLTTNIEVIGAS